MKEIELLEEAKKELSRIGKVMGEVSSLEVKYKAQLAELKEALPDLLARNVLKEGVTREEIDELKDSMRLFEERIDEIPIALEGLEPRRLRAQYKVRDIIKQVEKLYQSAKDELKDGDKSPALIEQLKACAPYIGMIEDAEEFLGKIKQIK